MSYITFCKYIRKLKSDEFPSPSIKIPASLSGEKRKKEKWSGEKKKPVMIGGEKEPKTHTEIDGMDQIFGDEDNN